MVYDALQLCSFLLTSHLLLPLDLLLSLFLSVFFSLNIVYMTLVLMNFYITDSLPDMRCPGEIDLNLDR